MLIKSEFLVFEYKFKQKIIKGKNLKFLKFIDLNFIKNKNGSKVYWVNIFIKAKPQNRKKNLVF